ncbi:MAG: carbohydrate-binding family 9-like protein [Treponema sp.]|nr:carbohydrate-binding family 9-like protein [Treponema sp.]
MKKSEQSIRRYHIIRSDAVFQYKSDISIAPVDVFPWSNSDAVDDYCPPTAAGITADDAAFYVFMETAENDIRAAERGFSAKVCTDSCMELFLMPDPVHSPRYFNWEFNPAGAMYLGLGTNRYDREDIILDNYPKLFRLQTCMKTGGWTLEYRIPFGFLGRYFPAFEPRAGHFMRGNFYKCGDKTIHPHYGCWSPIELPKPDFHCSDFFGEIILV